MGRPFVIALVVGGSIACFGLACTSSSSSTADAPDGAAPDDATVDAGPLAPLDAGSTNDGEAPADGGLDAAEAGQEAGGPVSLLEVTPAAGAFHVGLLTTIALRFTGALAPGSVTTSSVVLLAPNRTVGIPAKVEYDDATHTITLTPSSALTASSLYRIKTSGLTALDAAPIPDAELSFTTVYNAPLEALVYDSTGTTVVDRTVYAQDAEGRLIRKTQMGKGPDGLLNTADDVPLSALSMSYGIGTTRTITHAGPGPDAAWFTADDVLLGYTDEDTSQFGKLRSVTRSAAGPDGIWLSADDPITSFYEVRYDAEGREESLTNSKGLGPDGAPFTSDDVVSSVIVDHWTPGTRERVSFIGAGPDTAWGTTDDVVGNVNRSDIDLLGRVTALRILSAGPDGNWLTADDVTTSVWVSDYDTKGLLVRFSTRNNPGLDGIWLTPDDVLTSHSVYGHAANGARSTAMDHGRGPDNQFGTADDPITSVTTYETAK